MKRLLRAPLAWCLAWAAALGPATAGAESAATPRWQRTLDRVNPAVVVLRVSVPRPFDTEVPADELATGFVVDAERGLIVTNRHVVNPGPATFEAVFLDHEEVEARVVYRDPVHDFGFLQYDPKDVKFMTPAALALVPEHARVGAEVRVVGNDAGEKLSILTGTLARLDREAPNYGIGRYNDFNTFYYQAASSTSGGSSGSPVVDAHGHAVAINAGGRRGASSSFYLPLDPVVRALALIRRGDPVPRGTLQTVFDYRPYDEVRRLGLRPETESTLRARYPGRTGLLVVGEIIPGGPAEGRLEVGDVLLRVDGEYVTRFEPLAAVLDARVGGEVTVEVERGGEPLSATLSVQDLEGITPDEYVEMGGAVAHEVSYQQARGYDVPVAGVVLASSGYMFGRAGVGRGAVIESVAGEPIHDLDDFEARMASFADGSTVPLAYTQLERPHAREIAVVDVDRRWFEMQRCRRDAERGTWPCRPSPAPPPPSPPPVASTRFPDGGGRPVRDLVPSMVMVEVDIPYRLDGVHGDRFRGSGLVVDAERGLVVVDRDTVPIALADVKITFAESVQVRGEVVYVHPEHNLAMVRYDPAVIGDTPVRSAELATRELEAGDDVWLVGMVADQKLISRRTRVSTVEVARLPLGRIPRFRETNIELISLADPDPTVGGVVSDGKGRVHALWASFSTEEDGAPSSLFAGIPVRAVRDMLEIARSGGARTWRSLGAELVPVTLAEARQRGLSEDAARRIEAGGGDHRRVFSVVRLTAGTPAERQLRVGDLVLEVGGEPAASFATIDRFARAERVVVTLVREGVPRRVMVETVPRDGLGTRRAVLWQGALLQDPHPEIAAQRGFVPSGVYVAWFWFGSPANRALLRSTLRVVELDGVPTPDLDAFLAVVEGRESGRAARLKTEGLDGRESVVTLKGDPLFWPTTEIRRTATGWERVDRSGVPARKTSVGP